MNDKEKHNFIKKVILSIITLIAALILLYLLFYNLGLTSIDKEELKEFILSTGIIAPLIYILIAFLQVTFIPIPSTVTIIAGNYLFGFWLTFLYSYVGMVLGSMLAYYLGKLLGKSFINWLSGGKKHADKWISKLNGKENIVLFFMFLFPFFPDDLICSIAGILPITSSDFFMMQLITRATTISGTLVFISGSIIPFNNWGIPLIVFATFLCFVSFIYCFKYAEKINVYFKRLNNLVLRRKTYK